MGAIKDLMIGLTVTSFVAIMIILFMAGGSEEYGVDYNESEYSTYNKLLEINNISKNIRDEQSSNKSISSNPLDVLGDYFKSGYNSLKLTSATVDVADDMIEDASSQTVLGGSGVYLKIFLGALLVIVFVVGLISVLVGREP